MRLVSFLTARSPLSDVASGYVGWLRPRNAAQNLYPPAFATRGLALDRILFLECAQPAQALHALCQADVFDALVLEWRPNRVLLNLARRWLRRPECASVRSADALLGDHPPERLALFLKEGN